MLSTYIIEREVISQSRMSKISIWYKTFRVICLSPTRSCKEYLEQGDTIKRGYELGVRLVLHDTGFHTESLPESELLNCYHGRVVEILTENASVHK